MMKRKKDDTYQISTLVKLWDGFVPISEAFLPPFTISQKFAYFSDGPPYLDRTTSAIYQLDLQKKKQTKRQQKVKKRQKKTKKAKKRQNRGHERGAEEGEAVRRTKRPSVQ